MNIDRRDAINAYIQNRGEITLKELEELFPDVSSMTLRRDLAYLEQKDEIIRVRGGAKSIRSLSNIKEEIYSLRETENKDAKMKIAKKALQFIETGRSVFLDSGTTTMCLARSLPDENLFILTSGPNIGLEMIKKNKPSVTLIGGQLNRDNISVSGLQSLNFLNAINVDIAFIAASGFSIDSGFTSGNFDECELKRFIMKKARKRIMLMDTTKIDKNMPFTFGTLEDIDILICDKKLPEDILEAAKEHNVEIY